MQKDPAFLFYDGDAARDVSHMNRLERGCYFDLIQAQKKFGGYTVEQARKILGKDFESCWGSLELILTIENGVFFIGWLRVSIEKRKEHAEIQRKKIQKYWDEKNNKVIPKNYHGITVEIPLEDENANAIENENVKEIKKDRGVGKGRFIPPTLEEVKDYCRERNSVIDPETFFEKGNTNGWVDKNGNKYKDWRAVIRYWEKLENKKTGTLTDAQKRNVARFKEFERKMEAVV
jgi:hypothetical protein